MELIVGVEPQSYPTRNLSHQWYLTQGPSYYSRFSIFSVPLDSLQLPNFPRLIFLLVIFIVSIECIQCSQGPLVLLQLFLGLLFYNLDRENSSTVGFPYSPQTDLSTQLLAFNPHSYLQYLECVLAPLLSHAFGLLFQLLLFQCFSLTFLNRYPVLPAAQRSC